MIAALVLAAAMEIPPRPNDYVTDNAGALSNVAAYKIRNELQSYEQITKHHVIVWIGQTTGETPLEDWTIHAAEQWKVGRREFDDGAILFLFMRDHAIRIEVGYGLESALTDASAGDIIRNTIVPRMRAGDTDGAVQAGVDRILLTITPTFATQIDHPVASSTRPADNPVVMVVVFLSVILFFIAFITIFVVAFAAQRRHGGAWYGGSSDSFGSSSSGGGGGDSGSFGGSFGGGGASGSW